MVVRYGHFMDTSTLMCSGKSKWGPIEASGPCPWCHQQPHKSLANKESRKLPHWPLGKKISIGEWEAPPSFSSMPWLQSLECELEFIVGALNRIEEDDGDE